MACTRVRPDGSVNEHSPEITPHCLYRVVWSQHISSAESISPNAAVRGGAGATCSAYAIDAAAAIGLGGAVDLGHLLGLEAPLTALR